jgi:hypothetical protein
MSIYQKVKVKKGKWADSPQNPERVVKKRRDKFVKPKFTRATTVEGTLRREMATEIGEDELTKDQRFACMQKYGIIAARIDRKVTKPSWMEESRWRQLKQEFHNMTKGLIPQQSKSTTFTTKPAGAAPGQNQRSSKPWSQIRHKNHQQPKPSSRPSSR